MDVLLNSTGYKMYQKNIAYAKGCYVYDNEGNKYLDLEAGVWTLPLGHCDEDINKAIHQQVDTIVHCGYKYGHQIAEKCAQELLNITNWKDGKCVFLSSGSEAVEYGVQLAKNIRPNKKCVCLKEQYLSAYGNCMQKPKQEWEFIEWDYRENKSVEQYYKEISLQVDFSKVGIFVFEPGNSSGLVKLPSKNLVSALGMLCVENDIVIVVDEVTCGIGRTGKWFGYMHYDLKPHVVAVGKGVGNGYPVSAVIIHGDTVLETQKVDFHYAQSHQNDPLGCRVAYEVLSKIKREQLLDKSNIMAFYFMKKYKELQQDYSIIAEIRGIGLMQCIELSKSISSQTMLEIERSLFELGFIIGVKPNERVIRTYCPLIITMDLIDDYIIALQKVFACIAMQS